MLETYDPLYSGKPPETYNPGGTNYFLEFLKQMSQNGSGGLAPSAAPAPQGGYQPAANMPQNQAAKSAATSAGMSALAGAIGGF